MIKEPYYYNARRSGFTLVEFSVAIIIIGLVVGGIVVGQDMMHGAKLRRVATDVEKYQSAINAFIMKYRAVPGDMPNAFTYWPDVLACGRNLPGTHNIDCNGNGDGEITGYSEGVRTWRHLSLAGLIPQIFRRNKGSGQPYVASDCGKGGHGACPSATIPDGPIEKTGFEVTHTYDFSSDDETLYGYVGHIIVFGKDTLNNSAHNSGPALTVQDAMSLDSKADDGLPNRGKIMASSTHSVPADCVSSRSHWYAKKNVVSTWLTQNKGVNCLIFFTADF